MTAEKRSRWFHFFELAFSFNFIAFSFVMFSCLFPTGFSATFSSFAFISALPLFFHRSGQVRLSPFEKFGLVLFGWLLLSICWSEEDMFTSFVYLSEYRFYFMLPVFVSVLTQLPATQERAILAALIGALIALIASYGLGLGWWQFDGAVRSLADKIYHGFIMSMFLMATLIIARENEGAIRVFSVLSAILIAFNVLGVEIGRTGYIQVFGICIAFVILSFSRVKAAVLIFFCCAVVIFAYLLLPGFHDQINSTIANVAQMLMNDDYQSSAGYRLELYKGALKIGQDNLFGGVGVGDVVSELERRAASGEIRILVDNVHGEFMNMLVAGGVPAILTFSMFIGSIAWMGFGIRETDRAIGDALVGVALIVLISALFNSTIKDYGEKHALLIVLPILASKFLTLRPNRNLEENKAYC